MRTREEQRAYDAAYYQRTKARREAKRAANIDAERAADRRYYRANKAERNDKAKAYRLAHPEEFQDYADKYRSVPSHRAKQSAYVKQWRIKQREKDPKGDWWRRSACAAKARAKSYGIPYKLISSAACCDLPDVCPVLGIKLDYGLCGGRKGGCPDSPSIDRVIPKLGYVPSNVRVISHRANTLKRDATIEEFERIIRYMKSRV